MSDILPFPRTTPGVPEPRHPGSIPPFFRPERGTAEARREALERLRLWLLRAVGCERSLEILLELFDERLSYGRLADALGVYKSGAERLVAVALDGVRLAGVAEALMASLGDADVACVDPASARPLDVENGPRYAVPVPETAETAAREVEAVWPYLRRQEDRLVRKRDLPLFLLGRAAPGGDVLLDLVHLAEDRDGARRIARRLRTSAVIDLASWSGTEEVGRRRAA